MTTLRNNHNYIGTVPSKSTLTADQKKALALASGVGVAITVAKYGILGFVGYQIVKLVVRK
jgi:hypothetical protein